MKRKLIFGACLALAACTAGEDPTTGGDDEDLTSISARSRNLTFEGVVYVKPGETDDKILEAVHTQTQSAFGPLLNSKVGVNTREVQNVDKGDLHKRDVIVVDDAGAQKPMLEVRYVYHDKAVVPVEMAHKTALTLALLGQGAAGKEKQILEECTLNDKETKDDIDQGFLWYDFNPTKAPCRHAIAAEQKRIDDAEGKLSDPKKMVSKLRAERIYLPATFDLARADTATHATYPDYDRLFGGNNAQPGVLTIVMLDGRLAHEHVAARKDEGYYQWMDMLGVILQDNPEFTITKTEPDVPLTHPKAAGREWPGLGFKDFVRWTVYGDGWPQGLPTSARDEIADNVANMLDSHWITLEKTVQVSTNGGPPKDLIIRIETLFGCDEDPTPHQRAVSRGDVVIYNGHSYIGYGPLDPDNFKPTMFPKSYQMFFFDSCVSYNYYEQDFFQLKEGGSKNLDLITNGLEAPEDDSGAAEGRFVAKLISGSMPSFQTLLDAAKATDSLRVIDGEIDNKFDPAKTRIRVTKP